MSRLVFLVALFGCGGAAAQIPEHGPLHAVQASCLTVETDVDMDPTKAAHNADLALSIMLQEKGADICSLGVRVVAVNQLAWGDTFGAYEPAAQTVYLNRFMSSLVHEFLHVVDLDAGHWETLNHQFNGKTFAELYERPDGPIVAYQRGRLTNLNFQ